MAELIESIKENPLVYYIGLLVAVALLTLVIWLIAKNNQKKRKKALEKQEEKARIERHVDLEAMIAQMQEQNNAKTADPVASFEQEQEEKAIISYQELVNAVKNESKENTISVTNVSSSGEVLSTTTVPRSEIPSDKPIFLDEIKLSKQDLDFGEEELQADVPQMEIKAPEIEEKEEPKDFVTMLTEQEEVKPIEEVREKPEPKVTGQTKFKSTEFISPIYGRQNSNITYPKIASFKNDDEEIINISSDIDPNDEFLKTLREYRNND